MRLRVFQSKTVAGPIELSREKIKRQPEHAEGGRSFVLLKWTRVFGPARRIAVTEKVSKEARPESKEVSARTRARMAAPRATLDDGTLGHRFERAPQLRSARA